MRQFWQWRYFRILFGVVLLFMILSSKGLLSKRLPRRLYVRRFPFTGLCTGSFRQRGCQWCTIFSTLWSFWRRWGCVGFRRSCKKSRVQLMSKSCLRSVFMCGCLGCDSERLRWFQWQEEMPGWPRRERPCGLSGTCCPRDWVFWVWWSFAGFQAVPLGHYNSSRGQQDWAVESTG